MKSGTLVHKLSRLFRYVLTFSGVLFTACSVMQDRTGLAEATARNANLQKQQINTDEFTLITFHKGLNIKSNLLVVYIEGDGYAWKRKQLLSSDPTPRDPLALKLAVQDPNPAVLYIARPCQYLSHPDLKACASKYWSSHRYAEEVVAAINEVIDWGISRSGAGSVALYGYSGGGSIAALIAARRSDVSHLTTVAANLDHRLWTDLHQVSPLTGSLNAVDVINEISTIPQIHLVGAEDSVVPAVIAETYRKKAYDPSNIDIRVIAHFDHYCCWVETWLELLDGVVK